MEIATATQIKADTAIIQRAGVKATGPVSATAYSIG